MMDVRLAEIGREDSGQEIEALRRMVGSLAHDLKNVLQLISLQASMLEDPQQPEGVAEVLGAVERAGRLTQQLMLLSPRKPPVEEPAEPPPEPLERHALRLLLVEDDEADCEFLLRFLAADGFAVSYHRVDHREALEKALESREWDAIICDHMMPRFSGREALEIYTQSGQDIPFLVASGKIGEETAIEYMKAGAHDYLFKGNLARLAPALRRELIEARHRQEGMAAEEARRESQVRYQQIVETATEGIFIADSGLSLTFANRRLGEILGVEPAHLLGQSVLDYLCQEDRESAQTAWQSLVQGEPFVPRIERLDVRLRRGQDLVWVQVSLRLLKDHWGSSMGILGMVTDISERRLLQERLLLSEVEKRRFCRQVLQAVTSGKFQLIDSSELPGQGQVLFEVPLEGEAQYRQALHRLKELAQEQGLNEDVASEFTLAVGEAVTNVLKHAHDGVVSIGLRDDRLTARVSDQGPGIRAEDLPASILQAGFSTAVSLGMGYTLMLEMADTVWLASSPEGTVVQLERSLRPPDELDLLPQLALLERFS